MIETVAGATLERPLITFALFAFNQEKYISEAVEGAFSQTYERLEIILSDDCSSDRTFEIMQEMAAEYKGPHRVLVRRNTFNLGTALHAQSAFSQSSGALLVVAAGDDISAPERVEVMFQAWAKAGFPEGVIHSGRKVFRDGLVLDVIPAIRTPYTGRELEGYAKSFWLPAAAPTCAYTRGVFERFPPLMGGSIIEDVPLLFRAALIGKYISIDSALVRQRLHEDNRGTRYIISRPGRWNYFMLSKIIAFRNMQSDLNERNADIDERTARRIEVNILSVIKSSSKLLLPEFRRIGLMSKTVIMFKMLASPSVARTVRYRLEYALSFFGFGIHIALKSYVRGFIGGFSGGKSAIREKDS
ncbi:glycosyltransferase family 2 protein [Mesorhizobium sp.]|uniref:glycosyltransferase family 2 protein n=1 Tax=Mesorhizobium sp. TaxID=1871066 RepID=UPI0025C6BCBB|nr:glycosyltransferase family 2 protein [Mesorhizobium sp.]